MRTKYHWDWVASERPEWTERVEVEGSWGDDISIDYTFTDLNPEQEYNMSWTIWTHPMPTDTFEQEMVIDGGFTIINPNSDGNYDAVVSFQMLEEWNVEDVCIEYEIAIDGVDGLLLDGTPWGQTLRKCVNLEPAGVGGLPSVSGFVTIISASPRCSSRRLKASKGSTSCLAGKISDFQVHSICVCLCNSSTNFPLPAHGSQKNWKSDR